MRMIVCACAALALSDVALAAEIVVSPEGTTPRAALERIRAEKAQGNTEPWTVRVKSGFYSLTEPLVFLPEDSGSEKAPVRWVGEKGAVISGGARLTDWTNVSPGVWSCPIPKDEKGALVYFDQLWVNGERAARSRFPNEGYIIPVAAEQVARPKEKGGVALFDGFISVTNAGVEAFAALPQGEIEQAQIMVHHKWNYMRYNLCGFDLTSGTGRVQTLVSKRQWSKYAKPNPRESLCYFENVRFGFDAPGEWFYDAGAGCVLYRPKAGEDPRTAEIIAPLARLAELVVFKGDWANSNAVRHVSFEGFTFAHTSNTNGLTGPVESWARQAAGHMGGTISGSGARHVRFDRCRIAHTGNYGVRFGDGCVSNRFTNCLLEDLGAGGFWIGATKQHLPKEAPLSRRIIAEYESGSTAFNEIDNCVIRRAGKWNAAGTGVVLGHVSDSKVTHCEIYDLYYTGVSVGWSWGYGGSVAQRNEIAFNRIYDIGKDELSDMGGVYTLGTSFGTRIHDNVIHDVHCYTYGGWGLYTDEGSEGIVMENNLVYDTEDGCFHQHYGVGNTVRNNILAFNERQGALCSTAVVARKIPSTLNVLNNIVMVEKGPLLSRPAMKVKGAYAGNLWFVPDETRFMMGSCRSWAEWTASRREIGGLFADPQFMDVSKRDFRLKPTSPAFRLGFKPFDFSQAGLKKVAGPLPWEP